MKGFGFKQLKRQEGPSFYLNGFTEKRRREGAASKKQSPAQPVRIIFLKIRSSIFNIFNSRINHKI